MAKGDIISRLKLESGEFDSKIKRAGQELLAYSEHCRKMGLEMGYANRDAKEFAKQLGSMATVSTTARGKVNELSEAFVNAKVMYKNMTDEEKKGEFGKNLAASLDQLKSRLNSAKQDLADVNKELAGGGKFGEFGNILDTLGSKMGVTGNLTEMLTSKTALLTGAVGAGIAIVSKATEAWAGYNAELAKQDQITTVTTGLKGDDANRMTDTMRALSDTYNVDFRESINAANTLMTQFGKTGDEAVQIIKDGMQGMIQGDGPKLLQMIQQYAPAFRDAGVSASQLVAVIQNSEGGIFTDQNMNAIVMGIKNIRLMTKATSDALAQLGIDGQKMSQQLSDGSLTIFDALKQVAAAVQNVNSNSQAAGEVMQQVFGRQGAMAGTKLGEAIETLNTNLDETKRQTGEVGQSLADLQTANEKLNKAIRDCFEYDGWDQMANGIKSNLVTALATVLDYIGKIKGSLSDFATSKGLKSSGGYADVEKIQQWINNGKDDAERRARYDKAIAGLQKKLNNVGKERQVRNSDGSTSFVIDDAATQAKKREALQKRMGMLYATSYTPEPPKIDTTTSTLLGGKGRKGGGGSGKITTTTGIKDEFTEMEELVGLIPVAEQKVKDLQQQIRESWDQNEIATLRKQLKEAQNDLDVLQGKLPKDTVAQITVTADTADALKNIQNVDGVTIDPKTFSITATDEALPLLRDIQGVTIGPKTFSITATDEALPLLRDIQGVTIGPKTFSITATDEALPLLREIEGVTIDPKTFSITATDEALPLLRDIQGVTIGPKTFSITATDEALPLLREIEGVQISPKTVTVTANTSEALQKVQDYVAEVDGKIVNIKVVPVLSDADIDNQIEKQYGKPIEVPVVPKTMGQQLEQSILIKLADENMEADKQTLRTLLETQIKYGIEGIEIPADSIIDQIFGEGADIPDEYWRNLQEQINEKLREMNIEELNIDFGTGKNKRKDKKESDKKESKEEKKYLSEGLSQLSGGLGGLQSGFAQLGIDLGEGFGAVVGGLQTVTTILMAIQALVGAIETISALDAIIPFAGGGIVKAAMGTIVGNSYSGDNLRGISPDGQIYGLNAGEVVLNKSQVGNLASQLTGTGLNNLKLETYVDGRALRIVLNNESQGRLKGKYVTSQNIK